MSTSLRSSFRASAGTRHPLRRSGQDLVEVTAAAARDAQRWERLARFDEDERFALLLDRTGEHDLWLLTWLPGQGTGWHDHGGSTGAFTVARGSLRERRAVPGRRCHTVAIGSAVSRIVPDPVLHDVRNVLTTPAISFHAYSPPLTTMTYFDDDLTVRHVADVRIPGARR